MIKTINWGNCPEWATRVGTMKDKVVFASLGRFVYMDDPTKIHYVDCNTSRAFIKLDVPIQRQEVKDMEKTEVTEITLGKLFSKLATKHMVHLCGLLSRYGLPPEGTTHFDVEDTEFEAWVRVVEGKLYTFDSSEKVWLEVNLNAENEPIVPLPSYAVKAAAADLQTSLMVYDPTTGKPRPYPSHAAQYRETQGKLAWLYNPWTGKQRDAYDVGTDCFGSAIVSE